MKELIKYLSSKIGLNVRRSKILDLRSDSLHPLEIFIKVINENIDTTILLNIPISKCRTQLWNTLEVSGNPFVQTIIDYNEKRTFDYRTSAIQGYYERFQPKNASELLRINNKTLKNIPVYGYFFPWEKYNAKEVLEIRKMIASKENKESGSKLDLSAGHTDFGPVTWEKGVIEFNRLTNVFNSIKKNGYKEKLYLGDGGIKGYFLVADKDWCFVVKSGKHRAYALSALGYKEIPVVLNVRPGIVKRKSDISYWPQVINSVFTEEEAEKVLCDILSVRN
jgi:hypothetical protein